MDFVQALLLPGSVVFFIRPGIDTEVDMSYQKWLSDKEVAKRYSISRITVWRWSAQGWIPKPRKLSPGCTRWNAEELDHHDREVAR